MKCLPYGLFLGYFDHSNSIRVSEGDWLDHDRISKIRANFQARCDQYVKWRESIHCEVRDNEAYRPLFLTCFGNVDDLGVVLVDDLSDFTHIASSAQELLGFTLAIVPDHECLAASSNLNREFLKSPKELITGLRKKRNGPLIAVSHFKLSPIHRLVYGAPMQAAAIELTCKTVCDLLERLSKEPITNPKLFSVDDVKQTAFTVVSPLSADDVTVFLAQPIFLSLLTCLRAFDK